MQSTIRAMLAAGIVLACPAIAQDEAAEADPLNTVVEIETEQGTIVAQYSGVTKITSRTVSGKRAVTRADPYRCNYAVDLEVERSASLGDDAQARREISSKNVIRGFVPGLCTTTATEREIAREIELRERAFERELENVIRRDRDDVIAEIAAQGEAEGDE